jgi:hypothetical protein
MRGGCGRGGGHDESWRRAHRQIGALVLQPTFRETCETSGQSNLPDTTVSIAGPGKTGALGSLEVSVPSPTCTDTLGEGGALGDDIETPHLRLLLWVESGHRGLRESVFV